MVLTTVTHLKDADMKEAVSQEKTEFQPDLFLTDFIYILHLLTLAKTILEDYIAILTDGSPKCCGIFSKHLRLDEKCAIHRHASTQ